MLYILTAAVLFLQRVVIASMGVRSWGKCACVAKNGGELPYNHNGAIVQAKPLVYECRPSCKCPPSCYNRVSQQGTKFQLEIFKTEARGWGVRSKFHSFGKFYL